MHTAPTRRSLLKASAGLLAAQALPFGAGAAEPPHDVTYAEDFDELWRTLAERYCYFGEKRTDWAAVRTLYRPQAVAAASRDDFAVTVDRVLAELYDAHTHRGDAADGTARLGVMTPALEAVLSRVTRRGEARSSAPAHAPTSQSAA